MVPARRDAFLRQFTPDGYEAMRAEVHARLGVETEFRLSETPCFLPGSLAQSLVREAEALIDQLLAPDALRAAAEIVPPEFRMAHPEAQPTFLIVDFGLVETANGVEGRLVELQAFPSLFGFQLVFAEATAHAWGLEGVTPFLGGLTREQYLDLVGRAILGDHDPSEVVLMEIEPEHQKTLPDFVATEQLWGVRAVDLRSLERDGDRLFTRVNGTRTRVRRIYNRVIPDELHRKGLAWPFASSQDLDVEWAGGTDWFFRISKFSIPRLRHPWVPRTHFLTDLQDVPEPRDAWVLKPLFSFAGGGVTFAPTDAQIAAIPEDQRRFYILQERVHFTPTIRTPHGPTQIELRIMFVRTDDRYQAVLPLGRMGRGLMMGVDYNKGLAWVGATAVLVDPDA